MSAGPGWYPDPNAPGTVRYYDGSAWTQHTAPAGRSYQGQGDQGQGYQGQGYQGQGYGQDGYATSATAAARAPRWPFLVGGTALLLVVGGLVAWGATNGGWFDGADPVPAASGTATVDPPDPSTDPTTDATDPTTDAADPTASPSGSGEVVEQALVLDTPTTVAVPEGAEVQATVVLPADGIYLVSATSADGSDPYLTLVTPSGEEASSDYYPAPAEALGLSGDDAMIPGWFTAGPHTIGVSDYYAEDAEIEVTVTSLGEGDGALEEAVPTPITLPEGGVWIGYVDLESGQQLELDVRSTSGNDLTAAVSTWDGVYWENDDRSEEAQDDVGGDSLDPYVETDGTLEERVVVVISDFDGAAGTADVTPWIIR